MLGGTHWIVEGRVDPRWPVYTRGNIGEVFPEVLTPLSYELGVKPAEAGWREAYTMLGVHDRRDFATDEPTIIGLFGGYGYLNLSYLRILGVRAPGSSAQAIDVSLFGEGDPPAYTPRKGDKRPLNTVKILRTVLKALGQKELPWPVADSREVVAAWEAREPDLATATDDELHAFLRAYPPVIRQAFRNHMVTSGVSAIVSGVLSDAAIAAGDPGLVVKLLGAVDGVVSAQYAAHLWTVAELVHAEPALMAEFDCGVHGLGERLAALAVAEPLLAEFQRFIDTHGHRGPNDWELSSRTWENTPELAWAAVDVMRRSARDLSHHEHLAATVRERDEATQAVRPHLNRLDRLTFDKALVAAPWWARSREATRDLAIRAHNPTRRVFFEMARRAAERGGWAELRDVAMLHPITELPGYVADPSAYYAMIGERVALRDRFAAVPPPFFITSDAEIPSIEQLEGLGHAAAPAVATAGAVLHGSAGAPGIARGRARVVHDPADPEGLEPDEILIAPHTDPAWTPLFLPAAAVVVNVGALMSHAVIVSRELGIPCVVAVGEATERIANGTMIEVDGTAGTVTVLSSSTSPT